MNLDFEAAKISQKILSKKVNVDSSNVENLVTKTLGVLQENGVYACMLYLLSKDNEISRCVVSGLLKILKSIDITPPKISSKNDNAELLEFISNEICTNLDTLFLTKQLWEQTLLYARYGAKASSKAPKEER